jgi:polyisoprenoid-binding protein YceI
MKWELDPAHSSLEFAVRHMVVSTVKGTFSSFTAEPFIDPNDLLKSHGTITVDVASLDTREPRRDAHLRSADFFDVERFPQMVYSAKRVELGERGRYRILGELTIRDITREVELDAEVSGPVADPFGGTRIGVSAEARINRHDFGLDWNVVTEAGGLLVGDDVRITAEAEFVLVNESAEGSAAEPELEGASLSR